jgi:tetratricopeptide (TPR) repeat protein
MNRIKSDCLYYSLRTAGSRQARIKVLNQCILLAEQADDRWRLALYSLAHANESVWAADFKIAAQQLHANRGIVDEVGDPSLVWCYRRDEAQLMNFLTPIEEMADVEQICLRYVDICNDLGALIYPPSYELIWALCAQGKFGQARDEIDVGIAIMDERNDLDIVVRALYSICSVHFDDGSLARSLLSDLSAKIGPTPTTNQRGLMEVVQGRLALVAGDRKIARHHFEQALEKFRRIEHIVYTIWFSADLALTVRTRDVLYQAIDGILSKDAFSFVHWLLPAAALTYLEEGDVERAVELYALAETYPAIAKSIWYQKVAGTEIADSAEMLSPQIVAAAKERGRERDALQTLEELRNELANAASD